MDIPVLECPYQMDYFLMVNKERLFRRRTDVQNLTSQNSIQTISMWTFQVSSNSLSFPFSFVFEKQIQIFKQYIWFPITGNQFLTCKVSFTLVGISSFQWQRGCTYDSFRRLINSLPKSLIGPLCFCTSSPQNLQTESACRSAQRVFLDSFSFAWCNNQRRRFIKYFDICTRGFRWVLGVLDGYILIFVLYIYMHTYMYK